MRKGKKFVLGFALYVAGINLLILVTDNTYLYKALANTYLRGRITVSIDEYKIFENREVRAGAAQEWPVSPLYNRQQISPVHLRFFEDLQTIAFLIVKNDSIVYERYWDGYSADSYTNSFSMAKTIVSMLTGIALGEKKISSLDQPVTEFLPYFNKPGMEKITIRHLLTMTSGMDFDESYVSPFAFPARAYYGSDLEKLVRTYNVKLAPGKTFEYLSGNTQLLGLVLEQATGKSLSSYASEKLWIPLGSEKSAYWSLDKQEGHEKAYCCFNSNARNFARLGLLYLHEGKWKDKQLIPEDFARNSVIPFPSVETDGTPNNRYGYSWWIVYHRNMHMYYARGVLGQYVIIVPERNMVIVRLGHKRIIKAGAKHAPDMFSYIDAALEMYPTH